MRNLRSSLDEAALLSKFSFRILTRAVEQSPASVIITDLNGNIQYVNPKFTQVTGYSLNEVFGENPRFLKSGFQPLELYQELWQTIASGGEWRGELQNRKKDGQIYWEMASISGIRNQQGKVTHYLAIKENITEKKQQEEALKLAHAELDQIFNTAADAMCVIDTSFRLIRVNDAFTQYFGISREAALTKTCREIFQRNDCDDFCCPHRHDKWGDALRAEKDVDLIGRDGKMMSFIVVTTPFLDPSGKLVGVVKNFKDITQRKREQEALTQDVLLASRIQRELLPRPVAREELEIKTTFKPASHVSGDFYDYVYDEKQQVLSGCVIDIMGHGLATALQTSALRVLFRQIFMSSECLAQKVAWINQSITPFFAEDSYAAAICFEIDLKRHKMTYVSCGIHYFLVCQGGETQVVRTPGPLLGLMDEMQYEANTLPIAEGMHFLFMTDGFFDLWPYSKEGTLAMSYDESLKIFHKISDAKDRRDDMTLLDVAIHHLSSKS